MIEEPNVHHELLPLPHHQIRAIIWARKRMFVSYVRKHRARYKQTELRALLFAIVDQFERGK